MAVESKLQGALASLKTAGLRVYGVESLPQCEPISTGSLVFDKLLNGGIYTRKISHIFAKQGTGKSVLSYNVINNALHKYPESIAILVDIECRYDPNWGR